MASRTTRRSFAAAVLLICFVPASASAGPDPSVPLCDGKVATIVAPPWDYPTYPTTVMGTPGDDVIVGTQRNDTIEGGGGNDTICGEAGADTIRGGPGDDRLFGGLDEEYEPDIAFSGDRVEPGPGDDYIDLGHDPEVLDVMVGEAGDTGYWDQVSYVASAGPVSVDLAAGTATGEGTDTIAPIILAAGIEGSAHDDLLLGSNAEDWITGGGGDDTIRSRDGSDRIEADHDSISSYWGPHVVPGDDVVDTGRGSDAVWGGYGTDLIETGPDGDNVTMRDSRASVVRGGPGRDAFFTSGGSISIWGGAQTDRTHVVVPRSTDRVVLNGGAGRDFMDLEWSAEAAPAGSRVVIDLVKGLVRLPGARRAVRFALMEHVNPIPIGSASVTWWGTAGPDSLEMVGYEGRIRAFGRGGDDYISGGDRDDLLVGGGGNDVLRGGRGSDLLDGGPGRDRVDGYDGRDRCLRAEQVSSCERLR
jgi:Ca2+-binding RTX toxin-like protein